jgi:hypothetical protein
MLVNGYTGRSAACGWRIPNCAAANTLNNSRGPQKFGLHRSEYSESTRSFALASHWPSRALQRQADTAPSQSSTVRACLPPGKTAHPNSGPRRRPARCPSGSRVQVARRPVSIGLIRSWPARICVLKVAKSPKIGSGGDQRDVRTIVRTEDPTVPERLSSTGATDRRRERDAFIVRLS